MPGASRAVKDAVSIGKEIYARWTQDKAPRLAASISYFTLFSLAPTLVLATSIVAMFLDEATVRTALLARSEVFLGAQGTQVLSSMMESVARPSARTIASLFGVATLLWGASRVFVEIQDALNDIWGLEIKPDAGLKTTVHARLLSFLVIFLIGGILLVTLAASAALGLAIAFLDGRFAQSELLFRGADTALNLGIVTLLFATIYKVLPDAHIGWRDVWRGGLIAAVLFIVGRTLMGLYFAKTAVDSTYGAAGAVVILILWINYSANILLLGVEITRVFARRRKARIVPYSFARFTPEASAAFGFGDAPVGDPHGAESTVTSKALPLEPQPPERVGGPIQTRADAGLKKSS